MNKKSYSPEDFSTLAKNKEKLETFRDYIELQHKYSAAIREVQTKLDILNEEFRVRYDHNPIHHIESRLKSPQSMFTKLEKNGIDISIQAAIENLNDIAGIRVVCCYIDDVYKVANILLNQDDIILVRRKDYIKNPKPNGYRSLHLVLKVPIFLSDRTEKVTVEVQFRTIAMDMWASLEHKLRYKQKKELPENLKNDLQKCAEEISEIDKRLQDIHIDIQKL
ncbi:MAG: GTP pyrophosphokinase family protein [Oscillospiraceae bacterium]|nr:GTP pyrophosphokinase family protein [Oscillospiraceae bacterium]